MCVVYRQVLLKNGLHAGDSSTIKLDSDAEKRDNKYLFNAPSRVSCTSKVESHSALLKLTITDMVSLHDISSTLL